MMLPRICKLKCVVALLVFCATVSVVHARCPSNVCFCSKSTADRICNFPMFKNKCKVQSCKGSRCSSGFKCAELPRRTVVSKAVKRSIQAKIRKNGGCNANVCFAIDGSGSIDDIEWGWQIGFVGDLIDILKPFRTTVGGTQYSTVSHPIKPLSNDFDGFIAAMITQKQVKRSTSIKAGLEYCFQQLSATGPNDLKKAVVLGDGFQNQGNAVPVAQKIHNLPGFVSVVAVEPADNNLLNKLAENESRFIFKVRNYTDVKRLAKVIEELSLALCGP